MDKNDSIKLLYVDLFCGASGTSTGRKIVKLLTIKIKSMKKKTYIAPVAKMELVRVEKGFQLSCSNREPLGETDGSYTEQLGPGGYFITENISGSKSNMA